MQDEALHTCCLLLSKDPAIEAQPQRVVPKGYLSFGAFWEVCQTQPLMGTRVGKVVRGARARRRYSPKERKQLDALLEA